MDMDDGRRTEALEQVESEASSTSQQERLPGEGVNTAGPEGEQGVGGQVGTTVRTPPDEAVGEPIGTTVRTATEEVDGEQI
ncbi:MAG: hypothetical protein JOZ41_20335, partial [Chloroflexi bacterium]|nr:hypothetical protein [Chloroflexota bacterium]